MALCGRAIEPIPTVWPEWRDVPVAQGLSGEPAGRGGVSTAGD